MPEGGWLIGSRVNILRADVEGMAGPQSAILSANTAVGVLERRLGNGRRLGIGGGRSLLWIRPGGGQLSTVSQDRQERDQKSREAFHNHSISSRNRCATRYQGLMYFIKEDAGGVPRSHLLGASSRHTRVEAFEALEGKLPPMSQQWRLDLVRDPDVEEVDTRDIVPVTWSLSASESTRVGLNFDLLMTGEGAKEQRGTGKPPPTRRPRSRSTPDRMMSGKRNDGGSKKDQAGRGSPSGD
ncbi:hypothetical protein FB451DRAFT_1441523 [Mycena latifolia]|nr:hypothetical protein FB451DRAFT_1441523 [Mycena latifolia]